MSDEIRIIVVDDQLLMRDGLTSLLDFQPNIQVVGSAENGNEDLTLITETQPDVVLMDVQMPVMNGIEAAAEIGEKLVITAGTVTSHISNILN
ncbi:MAG: response regulator [Chloroflexota bacterium]